MDTRYFLNMIIKRLWIIILLPTIAGIASAYVSYRTYVPQYESSASLMIINKQDNGEFFPTYTDILAGQQLVKECKEIIKSRAVTKTTVEELGLTNLSWGELAQKINVIQKNETRILEIKIRDKDPERAQTLANKVSEVFILKAVELIKLENIQIIDQAEKPISPLKGNLLKNVFIAVLAGLTLALGIVFIIEELNDNLKTIEDVEESLNLKVVGIIPSLNIK